MPLPNGADTAHLDPVLPRLLLVTASYPPSRKIATRRMRRFATGLRDRGWDVTVLCPAPRYMQPLDAATSQPEGIAVIQTEALLPRVWLARAPAATASKAAKPASGATAPVAAKRPAWFGRLRKLVGTTLDHVEFPDQFAGWLAPALLAVQGQRFDVVLASAPPQTALVLGALVAAQSGAQLVLDYRDPWLEVMSPDGQYGLNRAFGPVERRLHRWLEDRVLADAQLVLGVTPRICSWLAARTAAPVHFLPNSVDALPPNPLPPRDRPLRLVYAGSLAYERSLDSVLDAMLALRPTLGPDALRLVYAGPHSAMLQASANAKGMLDQVEVLGEVGHAQALALYHGAAAGIVSVSARTDYSYPGKLFEIVAAGCPILLLGPAQSEAAKLVASLGVGVADDGSDPAQSAATLQALLDAPPAQPPDLRSWQAPAHLDQLDALLRGCLDKPIR